MLGRTPIATISTYLALASLAKSSSALASVRDSEVSLVWEGRESRREGTERGAELDEAPSGTSTRFLYENE